MANASKKILMVTDAWHPQVNGVVRTLTATMQELEKLGYAVQVIAPGQEGSLTLAVPFYREIRLEVLSSERVAKILDEFRPDYIHIATEGPLGLAVRQLCLEGGRRFTTAYHTCFPEYAAARIDRIPFLRGWGGKIAAWLSYRVIRRFHSASSAVMVATPAIEALLRKNNVATDRLVRWSRGVDLSVFRPDGEKHPALAALPRPIALTVGRVAVEKNIQAFLDADFAGSKVVVGDGPQLESLRTAYPAVTFLDAITETDKLAACYRAADLFVFPSKTDTFGLVLLEAMASGLPVACCNGPGQRGILCKAQDNSFYHMNDDLAAAIADLAAQPVDPALPHAFVAAHYSWAYCAQQFVQAMQATKPPLRGGFFARLLYDYALSFPRRVIANIPGLGLMQWGGRKLLRAGYRAWDKHRQPPPDDFA